MIYAKYDALDVAEYVLWYCEQRLSKAITNIQLQKILYYIQGRYIAEHEYPLFDNDMEAWDYGPVIPDVYYEYRQYRSNYITGVKPKNKDLFENDDIDLIENTIIEKCNLNVWTLVNDTHNEEPWIRAFHQPGKNNLISIEYLEEYFVHN